MDREAEVLEMIIEACVKEGAGQVILFGSRAKGTNQERSDFDIAVSGVPQIGRLREAIEELPTLYEVDLVDLDTCKNKFLLEDIAAYGRTVYEKV